MKSGLIWRILIRWLGIWGSERLHMWDYEMRGKAEVLKVSMGCPPYVVLRHG